jgi:hypothetical protein
MEEEREYSDTVGDLSKHLHSRNNSRNQDYKTKSELVKKEKENSKIREYRRFIESRKLSMEIASQQHEILRSKYNKIWMFFVAFNILISSTATILTTIGGDSAAFNIPVTIITATSAAATAITVAYGLHEKPIQHKTANGTATEIADEITRFLVKRPDVTEMSVFSDVIEEKIKAFRAMEPSVPMTIKHEVANKRLSEV